MAGSSDPEPKAKKRRGPGRPFVKGQSGNPGGKTPEEAQAQRELRVALALEWSEIHAALIALVKAGNAPAIIYAHKALAGENWQAEEDNSDDAADFDLSVLTDEEARQYLALRLKVSSAKATEEKAGGTVN